MKKLIITADDYGFCKSVNEAIEDCVSLGTVQATCVMMNMPAYPDMVLLKTRFPHLSIGIHWTVTQGRPVLPASKIPSLVGADGEFLPKAQFKQRWVSRQINVAELKAELSAQFQCFYELAGKPAFWCTHQDIHIFPGIFQTCVAAGVELGIPAMRCHRRMVVAKGYTPETYFLRHPPFWVKSQIVAQWSGWAEKLGMLMPDGQIQLRGYDMSITGIEQALNHLKWASVRNAVELTVHPSKTVDEKLFSSLKASRLNENRVFSDPQLKELIHSQGIQMVGFNSLNGHGDSKKISIQ